MRKSVFAIATLAFAYPDLVSHAASQQPDIVYLNSCPGGCVVHPGAVDDAINGTSSILSSTVTAPAFAFSADESDSVAACTRGLLAPYNIHVVANPPGNVARREIMLTTTSQSLGFPAGIPGIAPLDGHPHDNTIAFVFAGSGLAANVDNVCWSTATAIGNLYGMEPVVQNCPEIMSYQTGCGVKSFTSQDSTCDGSAFGTPGYCVLGNTTQNSDALLNAIAAPTGFLFVNSFEGFEVPHVGPAP